MGIAALAFTSARGVEAFIARGAAPNLPVFAVGEATAAAARAAGFADVRSAAGAGRDLLALILREVRSDGEVLYAGAREPAFDLVAALRLAGRPARAAPLYETVAAEDLPAAAAAALQAAKLAAVLIHSPAAARALAAGLRAAPAPPTPPTLIALSAECALPLAASPFAPVRIAATPDESSLLEALLGAGLAHG